MISTLIAMATLITDETPAEYISRIGKWRDLEEASLRQDSSWLTVVGLHWLEEGETTFSLSPESGIQAPALGQLLGTFTRKVGTISLAAVDPHVHVNGKAFESGVIRTDADDKPDKITVGSATITVIKRGNRIGLRVYDLRSKARKEFKGRKWFDVDPTLRIKARYVAYDKIRQLPITNVIGDTQPVPNPGYVEFTLAGKTLRLEAQDTGSGFFFNFRDLTSGKAAYPAGRFLDAPKPVDGFVLLDFNQATNPPCAFTDFATCPLPPKSNWLDVEIKAGELKTHH